ncbi:MAG: HAD-IA family hydrolase [Verrucomicrobiales bacterium]|nr:HAD-IA family hydrolase [Verrucomicrobiales bacterium]
MLNEPIRAVSFDAAGTLIHLAEPVGSSYSRVASRHGISCSPDALNRAFGAVWKRTPAPFSPESRIDDPNEKSWWKRIVREVFDEAGAELPAGSAFETFFEDLYDHFESPGTWVADPAAHEVLARVSQRYRIIILSNFDGRLRRILRDLELLDFFEHTFLSCEIGASKPDQRIFNEVVKVLDLPPQSILHVGDDPQCDWEGAELAGFALFRVGTRENSLGELLRELSLA